MNSRRTLRAIPVVLALVLAGPALVRAAEKYLSVAELARQSETVVRARVLAIRSEAPPGAAPFIFYRVRVLDRIKGAAPDEFEVRLPGVAGEKEVLPLPGYAPLALNLDAIFFINPVRDSSRAASLFELTSPGQAVMPVLADDSGQEVLLLFEPAANRGPGVVALPLAALRLQVKAVAQNQLEEGKR